MDAGEVTAAGILREVLDRFSSWPGGGVLWPEGGEVAHVSRSEWERWADALESIEKRNA